MLDGSYVDPARARYEGIVGRHILPAWGLVPLFSVAHSDVASWTTKLSAGGLADSKVRYVTGCSP